MKITLHKETFEKKVQLASKFISTKISGLQSLYGTYIKTNGKNLIISSTNLNDFFETTMPVDVEEEGEVIFETKNVLEFLHFLQEKKITLEAKEGSLEISQGKTKGTFQTYKKEEYPEKTPVTGKEVTIKGGTISGIEKVLFSASKDETRPVLTGVYITENDKNTVFVTTDGFRLSLLKTAKIEEMTQLIVPAGVLQEVAGMADGEDISFTKDEKENLVHITAGENTLISRILEGEFPPYEKVIPDTGSTTVSVDTKEFIKKIRLVAVFAKNNADVVILEVGENGLVMKPKGASGGSEVFVETEDITGESMKIAFNYRYLLDFLNNKESDRITMEFSQNTAPGVFRRDNDAEYLHIIMPLRTEETTSDLED